MTQLIIEPWRAEMAVEQGAGEAGRELSASAALVEELDRRVVVMLRDGAHVFGTLRSIDQFSNIVLEGAHERVTASSVYADKHLGLYVVRGENLVLLGRVDPDLENSFSSRQLVSLHEAREAARREREAEASLDDLA